MYGIGDCINLDKDIHMIVQIDAGVITLIDLVQGNRWDAPLKVKNPYKITRSELVKLIKSNDGEYYHFKKVKRSNVFKERLW